VDQKQKKAQKVVDKTVQIHTEAQKCNIITSPLYLFCRRLAVFGGPLWRPPAKLPTNADKIHLAALQFS
jgi:hypothetical protein